MATKTLITPLDGTPQQIVLADHAGDFNPTAANDLRISSDGSNETDVQLTLTGVADGGARESDQFDFGAHWAEYYRVMAALEFAATPVAGQLVELYFSFTPIATAANGHAAGLSGSDGDYTGYATNLGASVKQLYGPLLFICTADITATVQVAEVGILPVLRRYGVCVVKNESGAPIHSDDIECHIVLDPIVREFQDA